MTCTEIIALNLINSLFLDDFLLDTTSVALLAYGNEEKALESNKIGDSMSATHIGDFL